MQPSHQAAKQPCTDCLGNGKKTLKKCTHQKKIEFDAIFCPWKIELLHPRRKRQASGKKAEKVYMYKLKQVNKKNWIDGA